MNNNIQLIKELGLEGAAVTGRERHLTELFNGRDGRLLRSSCEKETSYRGIAQTIR